MGCGVVKEPSPDPAVASSAGASVASASVSAAGASVVAVVLPAGAVHALITIAATARSANKFTNFTFIQNSFSFMTNCWAWKFAAHDKPKSGQSNLHDISLYTQYFSYC